MSYDMHGPGVHCRGEADYLKDAPHIARLTFQVWPLPAELLLDLNTFLGACVASYLQQRGLASGEFTDLTAVGPMQ